MGKIMPNPHQENKQEEALAKLAEKLARAKQKKRVSSRNPTKSVPSGIGLGMRITVDFVAGLGIGVALGLYLDKIFDTQPIFLIVFMLIGFGAGLLNVIRTAQQIDKRKKSAKEKNTIKDD